mmetsp:Transcript_86421/g.245001  ORF Transcript_86421/g.245001 Transcript_86421/m.245001 type:complete len:207 (+) Transcript_86421:130-750(+)
MNFVRAGTLVQEITADGHVRDIVTERILSKKEKDAEEKEKAIRNLPEFQRARGEGNSLAEQLAEKEKQATEEEKAKPNEYNVHTIDEAEYEHYQHIEDVARDAQKRRMSEETTELACFRGDKKRFVEGSSAAGNLDIFNLQAQVREQRAARRDQAPSAADRLRGRFTVRAASAKPVEAPPAAACRDTSASDAVGGLVGYASSDSEG